MDFAALRVVAAVVICCQTTTCLVGAVNSYGSSGLAADAGLGQLTNPIFPWVCWKRDVFYGNVDARASSHECPDCGAEVKKDLSTRIHHCHNCGSIKPRDVASGQVPVEAGNLWGDPSRSVREPNGNLPAYPLWVAGRGCQSQKPSI
jgi:DNA-directed RNA polymerase subunit RPC12/RpoP